MRLIIQILSFVLVISYSAFTQNKSLNLTKKENKGMNKTNSQKIVKRCFERNPKFRRSEFSYSVILETTREELFSLLCPAREADWIPNWSAEIQYSESGYAEEKCIFTTPENNPHGSGFWTFTAYEPPNFLEFVKITEDMLTLCRITLKDNNDGLVTATWNNTLTALTIKGNEEVNQPHDENSYSKIHFNLLNNYLKNENKDKTKSNNIAGNYINRELKFERKEIKFSGAFKAPLDTVFALFCPSREADWIPGWDCELIFSESGYAEDKCVFITDDKNPMGSGVWVFTDYKKNEYVKFLSYQDDVLIHCTITTIANGDGTVTATLNPTYTALSEKGNKKVKKRPEKGIRLKPLILMIKHYLKKGDTISKFSLVLQLLHELIRH